MNNTDQAEAILELAMSGDRSPVINAQCREVFEHLEAKMRFIKSRYLIGLTDAELASLGLKPRKDRAPIDPRSDYGYRIYWGILPHGGASVEAATGEKRELMKAPVSGKELPHSRWTRRRRERFSFDGDSGKTAYFCIHYENSKGETGQFGPMFQAVIP